VDRSIEGGVHGVVACGSTGEFSALSSDERRLVVETVPDTVTSHSPARNRVPTVVDVSAVARAAS
jgi:4-hydroxy-tetrahydrodipicolinate synthase